MQAMINFLFALFDFCIAEFVRSSSLPYLAQGPMLVSVVDISFPGRHMFLLLDWMDAICGG